jgi:hypothetical protein
MLYFIAIKRTRAKSDIEDIDLSGARLLVILLMIRKKENIPTHAVSVSFFSSTRYNDFC